MNLEKYEKLSRMIMEDTKLIKLDHNYREIYLICRENFLIYMTDLQRYLDIGYYLNYIMREEKTNSTIIALRETP